MVEDVSGTLRRLPEGANDDVERTLTVLRRESEIAHVLLGLSAALAEVKTVPETLELGAQMLPGLFGAQRCCAVVAAGARLALVAQRGYGEDEVERIRREAAAPEGLPLLRSAMASGELVLIPDGEEDDRLAGTALCGSHPGAFIAVPLAARDHSFGAIGIVFDRPRAFQHRDVTLARGIARQLAVALSNARQFGLLQQLRHHGLAIASRLRLDAVIGEVARAAAALVDADAGAFYFLDPSRRTLLTAGAHGRAPEVAAPFARLDATSAPWSHLLEDVAVESSVVGDDPVTAVAAAVPSPGAALLGAVVVFYDRDTAVAGDHIEALSVLAAHSGMAIENAQRFERQRRVTRSLQEGLLVTDMPRVENCDIGTVYQPASGEADIGGDFFDVFELSDGRLAIVVGDVSGKGAEAAALTAMAKYMLRAFALRDPAPSVVLHELNNALAQGLSEDRFATLVYATFDPNSGEGTAASAGHPAPLVRRGDSGEVETLAVEGPLIGAFEGQTFEATRFTLAPGDVLVAFTDGLIDVRAGGDLYGVDRVRESLARHGKAPVDRLVQNMQRDALAFGAPSDDMVVFAVARR